MIIGRKDNERLAALTRRADTAVRDLQLALDARNEAHASLDAMLSRIDTLLEERGDFAMQCNESAFQCDMLHDHALDLQDRYSDALQDLQALEHAKSKSRNKKPDAAPVAGSEAQA